VQFVGLVIALVLQLFLILLFIRFVFDWVQVFARNWSPTGVLLVMLEIVYSVTDPPINLVRRFVPPLRIGSIMLDLAFIIVLISVYVLLELNRVIFQVP
jgi:YggT family protein